MHEPLERHIDRIGTDWASIVRQWRDTPAGRKLIDFVDGRVARATGTVSALGARFDMETDAAMVLVLSLLLAGSGRVGPWVLAAGGMRYAYVLAMRLWPWLRAAPPPSGLRKAICVAAITALIVCLGPIVPPGLAQAIALATVSLLGYSFGRDILWLHRHCPHAAASDSAANEGRSGDIDHTIP